MKCSFILALSVALVPCSLLVGQERPEPRYKGKPISFWIERLQKAETGEALYEALEAIKAFGNDAGPAVPQLVVMLNDRSADFRQLAKNVLCAIGPAVKIAVPELVKWLKDGSAQDPDSVIEILGAVGPSANEAIPVLIESLENRKLCDSAVRALCRIGPPAKIALPAIRRAIRVAQMHEDERVYRSFSLIHPLPGLGEAAIPLLIEFLDEKDINYQSSAASALGKLGSSAKQAVPKVRVMLKHNDPEVRRDAGTALWQIDKDTSVIPIFAELLQERARYLAEPAAQMLGEIGASAKEALPALTNALTHENDAVRYAARQAIQKIERGVGKKN